MPNWNVLAATLLVAVVYAGFLLVTPPKRLRHLPSVPVYPLLCSYLKAEPEDRRIKTIILPFASQHGHSVVLVWVFGMWFVHILDHQLGQKALISRQWVRDLPPQDLLMWKFVGRSNVAFTVGDEWRKHSRVVQAAFQRPPPIAEFASVTRTVIALIQSQSPQPIAWDGVAQRLSLDVLGTTILGHDFNAVLNPNTPFADGYRQTMQALMAPPYVFLPFLDKYFPRKAILAEVRQLRDFFEDIILRKRSQPGEDLISVMATNPEFSQQDILDNVSVLFVAGHETTSGALASFVYYLARHRTCQAEARKEVHSVLGKGEEPTIDSLTRMPYLYACIKESMRSNNPSNMTLPRSNAEVSQLGEYTIPAGTPMVFNICAVHHAGSGKPQEQFSPERFLNGKDEPDLAPFGLGLRQCPARNFAMWELRTVGAMLLDEFEWSLSETSPHWEHPKNSFSFTTNLNLPHNLDVSFTRISRP